MSRIVGSGRNFPGRHQPGCCPRRVTEPPSTPSAGLPTSPHTQLSTPCPSSRARARSTSSGAVIATIPTPQPVFDLVRAVGSVEQAALERTLNCGVGMVAITAAADVDRARSLLAGHGVDSWVCGEIGEATGAAGAPAGGTVTMRGTHPGW